MNNINQFMRNIIPKRIMFGKIIFGILGNRFVTYTYIVPLQFQLKMYTLLLNNERKLDVLFVDVNYFYFSKEIDILR